LGIWGGYTQEHAKRRFREKAGGGKKEMDRQRQGSLTVGISSKVCEGKGKKIVVTDRSGRKMTQNED